MFGRDRIFVDAEVVESFLDESFQPSFGIAAGDGVAEGFGVSWIVRKMGFDVGDRGFDVIVLWGYRSEGSDECFGEFFPIVFIE